MRHLYLNGAWQPSASREGIDVVNPATEETIDRVPAGSPADVEVAVAAARAAFPAWSATSAAERGKILAAAAGLIRDRSAELARIIATDMGAPYGLAMNVQTLVPAGVLASYAQLAETYDFEGGRVGNSRILREPVGVVAAITPWNYPLHQIVCKVAPALAAGCTVVLKPSEVAPLAAYALVGILQEAGLPAGVLNMVSGHGPVVGEALATHPDVDMVSFTGSTRAGRRVASLAAETVKRVALELGGKSASVILPDADLRTAVKATVANAFVNSGQTCSAWTRMIVHRDQYDEAVALAAEAAAKYTVGDPFDETTRLGPLVSAAQRDRVVRYINRGQEEGARLVVGGADRPLDRGFYVEPTVFAGVEPGMVIEQEEIFGPVLAIIPYSRGEDEAVAIANGTPYGLAGAVWAGDEERAVSTARRLRTGQVSVNGGRFNPLAPFGGYKQSGLGRELGEFGLEEFLEIKSLQL
ncbi:aldehyde dehydrogenase (NAD+) [Streptosporangium becharense]|uniref:aldehyde dehydrogenase (NAD(+)) n=1 Tax=Streptosporangium becharense TaxID=1816182 RepID=A0A7W9IKL0_9ACTN|nr:aldehyde dehydrogenase family protein [Streptosporangium becharense]MBB2910920.1 aldehyde dehydrogenase (NAD+) [Streptosporangium becharense]MBB5822021.1 aldehyde dehydrogenase (NAD+) [Streptosporangium becharense]